MEVVMMVLVEMMVVMMMMMMILMKSILMVVLMATISPLREGIPPAEFCLPERSFSLGVFRPAEARNLSMVAPQVLGFRGDNIRQRGEPGVDQGGHTTWWRDLGWPAPGVVWAPCGHLSLPLWLPSSSGKIGFSMYFPGFSDLREFSPCTFSIRILTAAVHAPKVINHAKTDEIT